MRTLVKTEHNGSFQSHQRFLKEILSPHVFLYPIVIILQDSLISSSCFYRHSLIVSVRFKHPGQLQMVLFYTLYRSPLSSQCGYTQIKTERDYSKGKTQHILCFIIL